MSFNILDLSLLKVLTTNKKIALDFANENDAKLFSPDIWNGANIIVNYLKTYKELPTLRVLTERLTKGNNKSLIDHLTLIYEQLDQLKYNDNEYKHDLEKIKKRFAEKQILSMKEQLNKIDINNIDISKTLSDVQKATQNIKDLNQTKAYTKKTIKEYVPQFKEEYNAKIQNPEFDKGIYTGYSYLDSITGGLFPSEFLIIGAESSGGKSMLLMNMAIQMWLGKNNINTTDNFSEGQNILYFSLEMPFKPCLNRLLARLSGIPTRDIRDAKLNPEDATKLKKSLKFISKYPFQFEIVDVPRGATIESFQTIYEEARAIHNPKIIVIDYLGLMELSGAEANIDDWLKLGKISANCHEFARVNDVIVLSAVQLNRIKTGGKDNEEKIGLHRVGRSAMIMHNANIALQILTRPQEKNFPTLEYHVIKCREGELGKGILLKNFKCASLLDSIIEENDTQFTDRDVDDISASMDLIGD